MEPFVIDPARLFEVDSRGQLYHEDPVVLARRARRMRQVWFAAVAVNAVTMPAGALAFILARPAVSAGFGLLALALAVDGMTRRRRYAARPAQSNRRHNL